ncbi:MAG: hypothetical protein ACK451_12500 [Pseudanabaena sp.]
MSTDNQNFAPSFGEIGAVTRLTQSQESQWQAIREMQIDVREMHSEARGLEVENRRILQRVFGNEF